MTLNHSQTPAFGGDRPEMIQHTRSMQMATYLRTGASLGVWIDGDPAYFRTEIEGRNVTSLLSAFDDLGEQTRFVSHFPAIVPQHRRKACS